MHNLPSSKNEISLIFEGRDERHGVRLNALGVNLSSFCVDVFGKGFNSVSYWPNTPILPVYFGCQKKGQIKNPSNSAGHVLLLSSIPPPCLSI